MQTYLPLWSLDHLSVDCGLPVLLFTTASFEIAQHIVHLLAGVDQYIRHHSCWIKRLSGLSKIYYCVYVSEGTQCLSEQCNI